MIHCNVCGSENTSVRIEGAGHWDAFDPNGPQFPYEIAICRHCGHIFGQWPQDMTTRYVRDEYATCADDLEQYTTYVQFLLTDLPHTRTAPRILEIGCNHGALLHRFYKLGFDCVGLEPGPRNIQAARNRMPNAQLDEGLFNADWLSQFPENHFDVIMLTSVFEHLPNPTDVLKALRSHLAPEGRLFLIVPDLCAYAPNRQISRTDAEIYGSSSLRLFYRNIFLSNAQHISHFSAPSLTRYLRATGFRTTRLATLGNLWILAAPSEYDDFSFDAPDIVSAHSEFLDRHQEMINETHDAVINRLSDRRVVCYGAGADFAYFLSVFEPRGAQVLAVADDNPEASSRCGIPCVSAKQLRDFNPDICVMTSFDHESELKSKAIECLPKTVECVTLTELLTVKRMELPHCVEYRPGFSEEFRKELSTVA